MSRSFSTYQKVSEISERSENFPTIRYNASGEHVDYTTRLPDSSLLENHRWAGPELPAAGPLYE
eukprot:1364952-Amorphochlora_amoeboformis.AAC.1